MRTTSAIAVLALLACSVTAQKNLVTNGDFSAGMAGWTGSGGGDDPRVANFDVTGLGVNAAFGVNAGPKVNTTQRPPYVLSQSVMVTAGTHELYIDMAWQQPRINRDPGRVEVRLGGTTIAKHQWFFVGANNALRRTVLCVRIQPKTAGKQRLEIAFYRNFASLRGQTPRHWVDNVGLWATTGATFCLRGERKPGRTVDLALSGKAGDLVVVFGAAKTISGFTVPGFTGTWRLDLTTSFQFFGGSLDGNGNFVQKLRLPSNLSQLQGVSLFFQPISIAKSRFAFGVHHDYGLQK